MTTESVKQILCRVCEQPIDGGTRSKPSAPRTHHPRCVALAKQKPAAKTPFAGQLEAARLARALTSAEFAELLGVSRSAYSRYRLGAIATAVNFAKIEAVLRDAIALKTTETDRRRERIAAVRPVYPRGEPVPHLQTKKSRAKNAEALRGRVLEDGTKVFGGKRFGTEHREKLKAFYQSRKDLPNRLYRQVYGRLLGRRRHEPHPDRQLWARWLTEIAADLGLTSVEVARICAPITARQSWRGWPHDDDRCAWLCSAIRQENVSWADIVEAGNDRFRLSLEAESWQKWWRRHRKRCAVAAAAGPIRG